MNHLTQQAIMLSGEAANQMWMARARDVVVELAKTKRPFTTDDIWLKMAEFEFDTREHRAMGAVMLWGKANRIIENLEYTRKSQSLVRHRRPLAVWRGVDWKLNEREN